jgi:hypothetical protein
MLPSPPLSNPHLLEPAITIISNEHKIYYAYPSSLKGDVTVLGPDEKFSSLSTRSVQGIFKLVRFYGRMLAWGVDKEATTNMQGAGLWDACKGRVTTKTTIPAKHKNASFAYSSAPPNCVESAQVEQNQIRVHHFSA